MDRVQIKRLIEGMLLISDEPVALKRLTEATGSLEQADVRVLVDELNQQYLQAQHAFRIQEVAGGFQLVTDPELAPALKRAMEVPKEDVFSKAAMETLSIIAYRQPLTKADIELIRGVDVSGTLETLLERQFVRVVGRKETPGRPLLYGTTVEFLRHLGLKDLKDLPKIAGRADLSELLAHQAVQALQKALDAAAASAPPDTSATPSDATAESRTVAQPN